MGTTLLLRGCNDSCIVAPRWGAIQVPIRERRWEIEEKIYLV